MESRESSFHICFIHKIKVFLEFFFFIVQVNAVRVLKVFVEYYFYCNQIGDLNAVFASISKYNIPTLRHTT